MNKTRLTEPMIDSFPAVDIHVHVPGTISPQTAWDLGIRNGLISIFKDSDGRMQYTSGPKKIGASDPVGEYTNIFCAHGGLPLNLDDKGNPIDLDYNYACLGKGHDRFSGFDAIQGTTQGHRHRPGGIQNESDYRFVMKRYLESCLEQNIIYTETSQNLTIAQVLYPELAAADARAKFVRLCQSIIADYAHKSVTLRFYHCANKTGAANINKTLADRADEWADWLEEAHAVAPGVFIGLTTAGHEKMEIEAGGPRAMAEAYQRVADMGLGCEGHYGEGAGVEHMEKAISVLPKGTRIAHGIQVIESLDAIDMVKAHGIPLIMMPSINIGLGGVIHYKDGKPHAKLQRDAKGKFILDEMTGKPKRVEGIVNHYITKLEDHPIFPLMREHGLPVALASDDPEQGGIGYKAQLRELAGFTHHFPAGFMPLTAEELVLCNLNAIQLAFCETEVKQRLVEQVSQWAKQQNIVVDHPLLTVKKPVPKAG